MSKIVSKGLSPVPASTENKTTVFHLSFVMYVKLSTKKEENRTLINPIIFGKATKKGADEKEKEKRSSFFNWFSSFSSNKFIMIKNKIK